MTNILAPVAIFTYKRVDTLEQTINSLLKCDLAPDTDLFIFSDGPKGEPDKAMVAEVREFLKSIKGFKSINLFLSDKNQGLANSIINGVTKIINEFNKIIVLEDDLVLSSNFLVFMNEALSYYEKNDRVFSVSGFMFDIKNNPDYDFDVFFTRRHCSWGWAMWKDRWNEIDWEVKDYDEFSRSSTQQKAFNDIGADLSNGLAKQMKGQVNSWAIRCNYFQFKKGTYTVYPLKSKIVNVGFNDGATHTNQRYNKYHATLDQELKQEFLFSPKVFEDRVLISRFKAKYSKLTRLGYFILNKIFK